MLAYMLASCLTQVSTEMHIFNLVFIQIVSYLPIVVQTLSWACRRLSSKSSYFICCVPRLLVIWVCICAIHLEDCSWVSELSLKCLPLNLVVTSGNLKPPCFDNHIRLTSLSISFEHLLHLLRLIGIAWELIVTFHARHNNFFWFRISILQQAN